MAAEYEKPKFSKIGVIPGIAHTLGKTTLRAYTSPFRSKDKKARTYRRDVLYELLRHSISNFDLHQGQWILPGTDAVYKYIARKKKWKANTVNLEHGARGHWLGHSDAKYVLVYFHGGGYIAPATPGHMKYQFALQKYLRKQGIDLSVLSLAYVLAPQALHPSFIQQGLSAITYLIEKTNRDPSTIIIGGDSAGGNMVANILLHLGHPHPECAQYTLTKKLKGALMISPWISFETEGPSFEANKRSDYLTTTALKRASAAFIGPDAKHDVYSQPVDAPVEWWTEVANAAVDNILIWGGGGEVLIDGIKKFAGNVISGFEEASDVVEEKNRIMRTMTAELEKEHPVIDVRAKLVVSPHEAHEEMIINYLLWIKKEEDGGRQIKRWLVDLLTQKLRTTITEPTAEEVKEAITEKKDGVADTKETIEQVEKSQEELEKRELVEEEKKKAAEAVAPIA